MILSFIGLVTYAISWPSSSKTPTSETTGGIIANVFSKILVNTGSTSDGTVKATEKVVNQDCGAGKFLQGFDSSGNKICVIFPTIPCTIGTTFEGGKCAGQINGYNLISTPSGCTNSSTPTCAGGNDTVTKAWGTNNIPTGISSSNDGDGNTISLANNYADTYAAKYCYNMIYGGYSDWYLPSKEELLILYNNQSLIGGGFQPGLSYYSSTEVNSTVAWNQDFNGDPMSLKKDKPYYIRCVRKSSN